MCFVNVVLRHGMCRLMSDTQSHHRHGGQRGAQLGELADPLLLEEYLFLRGDIMHHLCFCYLQCGQLDYALEEAQRAIGVYEGVHQSYKQLQENDGDEEAADGAADDDNILARAQQPQRQTILQSLHACTKACYPNEQPGERGLPGVVFRLRHAWGLMAVVRKRRRENGLSEVALEKVRALQLPGPVMAQGMVFIIVLLIADAIGTHHDQRDMRCFFCQHDAC